MSLCNQMVVNVPNMASIISTEEEIQEDQDIFDLNGIKTEYDQSTFQFEYLEPNDESEVLDESADHEVKNRENEYLEERTNSEKSDEQSPKMIKDFETTQLDTKFDHLQPIPRKRLRINIEKLRSENEEKTSPNSKAIHSLLQKAIDAVRKGGKSSN